MSQKQNFVGSYSKASISGPGVGNGAGQLSQTTSANSSQMQQQEQMSKGNSYSTSFQGPQMNQSLGTTGSGASKMSMSAQIMKGREQISKQQEDEEKQVGGFWNYFKDYKQPKSGQQKGQELVNLFKEVYERDLIEKANDKDKRQGIGQRNKEPDSSIQIFETDDRKRQKISHFSMGTFNYIKEGVVVTTQYVPIFPELYDQEKNGQPPAVFDINVRLAVFSKKVAIGSSVKVADTIQIGFKFQWPNQPQFKQYQLDLRFENISKLSFYQLADDKVQIVICLRKAARVLVRDYVPGQLKSKEFKFLECPSPLMFQGPEKVVEDAEPPYSIVSPDEKRMFMNMWNLKPVVVVEGTIDIANQLDQIHKEIESSDLIQKVILVQQYERKSKYMLLHEQEHLKIKQDIQKVLFKNNDDFNKRLKEFPVPIRFSFLTLLCARKCTIFSDSIFKLMDAVKFHLFPDMNQQQIQELLLSQIVQNPLNLNNSEDVQNMSTQSDIMHDSSIVDNNLNDAFDKLMEKPDFRYKVKKISYILDDMCSDILIKAKPKASIDGKNPKYHVLVNQFEYLMKEEHCIKIIEEIEQEDDQQKIATLFRLRRVFQTPTLTFFAPLQREETHRVIRKYKEYKDYFFRLTLSGEMLDKIHFGGQYKFPLLNFMIGVLGNGIKLGEQQSSIVNYSNSQLKNHSVWMLVSSSIEKINKDKIIEDLGTFNAEEGFLKMFARRGQCFTTTKYITKIEPHEIEIIDDIQCLKEDDPYAEKGEQYTFTDGCGNISLALCKLIDKEFGLYMATAYQVRLGGAKGVLVCKKTFKETERKVQLRKSQIKFQSKDNYLEVIRCSTFSQGYLNRQVILLLSALGVPNFVFEQHLDKALRSMNIDAVFNNLRKIYTKAKQGKNRKSRQELALQMDLFFGPSKIFCQIFKLALLKTFESLEEIEQEQKAMRALQEQEESKSPQKQDQNKSHQKPDQNKSPRKPDYIDKIEQLRDQGVDTASIGSKSKQQAINSQSQHSSQKSQRMQVSHHSVSEHAANFQQKVFSMEKEPIFDNILRNMVLGNAVNLKKKARIKINDACVLIGIIDENGILDEGEVFITYNQSSFECCDDIESVVNNDEREEVLLAQQNVVVSGPVIVTKNPCSHPGDIRLLKAVGKDDFEKYHKLRDLVNVIVFSCKGKRPEQQKMSGGDLDGDVYLAMWDKTIINHLDPKKITTPANYKKFPDTTQLKSNKIEQHIKRYFEKDNLGHLSNLHLALCDQAYHEMEENNKSKPHLGWFDDKCKHKEDIIKLSWLISIAVDFAKHGKCVDNSHYSAIEAKLKRWPDYLEGSSKNATVLKSDHVLGLLYRNVECKDFYKQCIEGDHNRSILLSYKLNCAILNEDVGEKYKEGAKVKVPAWHELLRQAYLDLVYPMTEEIKKIMVQYKIINEGELFCTNLIFDLDDEDQRKLIGDPGKKDEDAVKALNQRLKTLQDEYINLFKTLADTRGHNRHEFAKAVYFTAYFNPANSDCKNYLIKYWTISLSPKVSSDSEEQLQLKKQASHLLHFESLWKKMQAQSGFDWEFHEQLEELSIYKKTLKKGKVGSDDKIMKILTHKQFFSVPWLICYKEYLE